MVAMRAVIEAERALGHKVSMSRRRSVVGMSPPMPAADGEILARHIEVKGRAKRQTTITVSRNEILYGLNQLISSSWLCAGGW